MPFITEDSGICVSSRNGSRFTTCAPIVRESDENYVFTEDEFKIYIENGCSDSVSKFDCNFATKIVDSGRFVKITNSCSLPLEITGLVNSDPVKFSLFDYPKYRNHGSIYSSENTAELPVTLNPAESFEIPTFFHPSMADMENANAGSIQDLNNQESIPTSFGARVDIYPGFNISNCSTDQNSCDAYFTLTGTVLCGDFDVDWMNNQAGLMPEDIDELDVNIQNDTCIKKTETMQFVIEEWTDDLGFMQKLNQSVDAYTKTITSPDKKLSEIYGHIGMYGALEGMGSMIEESNSIDELINSTLSSKEVVYSYDEKDYSMTVNYNKEKNSVKNIDGANFTGFFYDIVGDLSAKNQTVFINAEVNEQSSGGTADWISEFVAIADQFESLSIAGNNLESLADAITNWEVKYSDKITPGTNIPVDYECQGGAGSWTHDGYVLGMVFGERGGDKNWGAAAGRIAVAAFWRQITCGNGGLVVRKYADALVDHFGSESSKQGIVSIFTADEGDYNNVDFCNEAPIAGAVWINENAQAFPDLINPNFVSEFVAIADAFIAAGGLGGGPLGGLMDSLTDWEKKYLQELKAMPEIMVNSAAHPPMKWDPSVFGTINGDNHSNFAVDIVSRIILGDIAGSHSSAPGISALYIPKAYADALVDHFDQVDKFIQILELEQNNRASFHYIASNQQNPSQAISEYAYQGNYEFNQNGDAVATFKMFNETIVIELSEPVNGWEAGSSTEGKFNEETRTFKKSNENAKEIINSSQKYVIFDADGNVSQKKPSSAEVKEGMEFPW